MRESQASEAKTHLPQLLDDVGRAETMSSSDMVNGKITADELVSAKHEGHEY
jgi:hypothetical protein